MREIRSDKFVELLDKAQVLDVHTLHSLQDRHQRDHSGLLEEILDKGYCDRELIGELWAQSLGVAFVNPMSITINCEETKNIPIDMAKRILAIGLYQIDDCITMAMNDPTNRQLVESLERLLQFRVSPVYAHADDIEHAIEQHYHADLSFDEALRQLEAYTEGMRQTEDDRTALSKLVEANALIEITNRILHAAFKQRASDIHIEPFKEYSRIRLRVDGKLRELTTVPKDIHKALIVRIKFISELDIAETRLPQDGRFNIQFGSFEHNFRVSTCPALHGEKAVLRLLGQAGKKGIPTLDELSFSVSNLARIRSSLSLPNGIFICTGPTGSGKTTTLYSAIDFLNDSYRNIMTIENPVEYQLTGVNHFEVRHGIGLNFARVMRAALRQDPDILLVGEIRDEETALIATEAALTGHLVLTSLHTKNAAQAVLRLVEMGIEPHLVAPALNAVMSQRLVGHICEHCKEAYHPPREVLERYFLPDSIDETIPFYRSRGCSKCFKSGYQGRIAVHEIIEVSENMRDYIVSGAPAHQIQSEARRIGFSSLREDALSKAILGLTTLEEVERLTNAEYRM